MPRRQEMNSVLEKVMLISILTVEIKWCQTESKRRNPSGVREKAREQTQVVSERKQENKPKWCQRLREDDVRETDSCPLRAACHCEWCTR